MCRPRLGVLDIQLFSGNFSQRVSVKSLLLIESRLERGSQRLIF